MKIEVNGAGMKKNGIMDLNKLWPPLKRLFGVTFDLETGELKRISVADWFSEGLCIKYALVLYGLAGCGKSPAANALAAALARDLQDTHAVGDPYFIKVGTSDALLTACAAGLMVDLTPIHFDDLTPSWKRGTRPCMSVEDVKHLVMVEDAAMNVNARGTDIQFADKQPRIFSSNATSIQD
eukprot:16436337-Heterocapsa_arctica.AAC.1